MFLQDFDQILQENSFLLQDLQDIVQDFARKILTIFAYFLQDCFYWVVHYKSNSKYMQSNK